MEDVLSGTSSKYLFNMKNLVQLFILFLLFSCGPKPPTDLQVKDWYRELYNSWTEAKGEAAKQQVFGQMTQRAEQTFDVKAMTLNQVMTFFNAGDFDLNNNIKLWLVSGFTEKAQQNNREGAEAAYAAWKFLPIQSGDNALSGEHKQAELAAYRQLLNHPAWDELVKAREEVWEDVLEATYHYSGGDLDDNGLIERWLFLLEQELPESAVKASMSLFEVVFQDKRIPPKLKEQVREKVLQQYISLLGSGKVTGKRKIASLEEARQYLEGAYAKGELLGNPAPQLDFIWTSQGNAKSLSDLKGQVVLLDFWGTKCAPCISIFPEVRKLVKYYQGYPVEIIGVASIQGYHVDLKQGKTIRTDGKPQQEMELMKTFMKDMDMTWTVAFSKQPVFNPEYGVRSIPHVVLIDADGIVRENGLDPFDKVETKMEKINIWLKKAGLPYPAE